MGDWLFENLGWVLFFFLALCIVGLFTAIVGSVKEREKFMAQCQADGKKEYQCTAMWRAGESHDTVMPMPIVIPMGR